MKKFLICCALVATLLSLSGCDKVHTEIDGENEQVFLESVEDLQINLSAEQIPIFERGLVLLKRNENYLEEMDGMDAGEIMDVELERLRGILDTRLEKQKKFDDLAEQFTSENQAVPENIRRTLADVAERIEELEAQLAVVEK